MRVADLILKSFDFSPCDFLWGNLAPDCGVPVEGGFDPPGTVTHWTDGSKSRCDYERFYREMICGHDLDERTRSFLTGYYTHLMADVLWSVMINIPCKERLADIYTRDREEYYRLVKPEWYANDHLYIANHPDEWYLKALYSAGKYPVTCIPYYAADNVENQLHHIGEFYRNPPQYSTDFHYLTPQMADDWVKSAAAEICKNLRTTSP